MTREFEITAVRMHHGLLSSMDESGIAEVCIGNFYYPKEVIIKVIEMKMAVFYTQVAGSQRAYIDVIREKGKDPYLKSRPDWDQRNNLLSLPGGPNHGKALLLFLRRPGLLNIGLRS